MVIIKIWSTVSNLSNTYRPVYIPVINTEPILHINPSTNYTY